ncbi:MAG: hypothetical protein M0P31_18905 [Solirubrobacteraceae bacterium]|nr:hypothetical protein [Solirubrobacteraceae bacterium]
MNAVDEMTPAERLEFLRSYVDRPYEPLEAEREWCAAMVAHARREYQQLGLAGSGARRADRITDALGRMANVPARPDPGPEGDGEPLTDEEIAGMLADEFDDADEFGAHAGWLRVAREARRILTTGGMA